MACAMYFRAHQHVGSTGLVGTVEFPFKHLVSLWEGIVTDERSVSFSSEQTRCPRHQPFLVWLPYCQPQPMLQHPAARAGQPAAAVAKEETLALG